MNYLLTTSTVIGNSTSLCSLAVTVWVPSDLMGSMCEVLAVDDDLGLLFDSVSDIGRGDRAVQLAFRARLGRDGDDLGDEGRGDGLGAFTILGVAQIARRGAWTRPG